MLLSTLAESVYWLGRYMERAENTARLVLVNDALLLDIPAHCNPGWAPTVQITGSAETFFQHYATADENSVIRFILLDRDNNPGSLLNSVVLARENLRTTRALFPKPVWEVVNDLHSYVSEQRGAALTRKRRYGFLRRVIDACHLLAGKLAVTCNHDEIYEFVRMGLNLERADMTSRVIDIRAQGLLVTSGDGLLPFDDIQWKSLLDSLAAWQMYRRRIAVRVNGVEVVRFLLKDRQFPRSVNHCLGELEQSLYALAVKNTPRQALMETRRKVREVPVESVTRDGLHIFVDEMQQGFAAIHSEIAGRYFDAGDATLAEREGQSPPETSVQPAVEADRHAARSASTAVAG